MPKTKKRGFAAMDKGKQREVASQGGKASGEARRGSSYDDYLMSGSR